MKCHLAVFDVVDTTGEQQVAVEQTLRKIPLDELGAHADSNSASSGCNIAGFVEVNKVNGDILRVSVDCRQALLPPSLPLSAKPHKTLSCVCR